MSSSNEPHKIKIEFSLPRINRMADVIRDWLPSKGNVLFTLITVGALAFASRAGALQAPAVAAAPISSSNTIPYQGRMANASGQAITGTQPMIFRLYNVASGGTHLWEEQWTGPNSVRVSDGLFNVMLGSLNSISQAIITSNPNLWLGITVGSDNEMTPRVQLGSVPFATQALTVPDGSITSAKLDLASGLNVSGGVTTTGNIMLTSGSVRGPLAFYEDYRAYFRFMKEHGTTAAGMCPEGGEPLGVVSPLHSLERKTGNEIAQVRFPTAGTCVNVHKVAPCATIIGDHYPYGAESCSTDFSGKWSPYRWYDGRNIYDISTQILESGVGCQDVVYACVR